MEFNHGAMAPRGALPKAGRIPGRPGFWVVNPGGFRRIAAVRGEVERERSEAGIDPEPLTSAQPVTVLQRLQSFNLRLLVDRSTARRRHWRAAAFWYTTNALSWEM